MYIFYGYYTTVTKDSKKNSVSRVKPFYNWVHRKTSNGRSRYGPKVEQHFAKFIVLFHRDGNETSWTNLLTDGGESKAPMEYLVAVEEGLRGFGADGVHTMGTMPLRSRLYWSRVDKWRKREAYIALARYVLGIKTDYKQWDCFRFSDYSLRQRLHRTFNTRHFPLSDGKDQEHFGGMMKFDWSVYEGYSPRKKKKTTQSSPKHRVVNVTDTDVGNPAQVMVYDVENDCLVPL